jgi:DNA-binding transcriptional LysR family regulator
MAKLVFPYKQNRLQQLRGFCYAAQTSSISRAAKRMFLSQPSVSLQIQALERELSTHLFERRGPKIRLTSDGRVLLDMVLPLVQAIDSLDEEFAARRKALSTGKVDIAAGGSTILYVLPKFVEQFVRLHPNIELILHNVTGKAGLELLMAGEVDFAVGPLLETPGDLLFHPILSYDPVLITCLNHPLSQLKKVTLKQISGYPLILPPKNLSTWRMVEIVFSQNGLSYEVKLEVGGWEVIKKYVELGLGISIVMSICLTGDEKLERIPVGNYFPKRTYGIVLRRHKQLSAQANSFIELMDPKIHEQPRRTGTA